MCSIKIREDGSFAREGPWSVLVSGESATRGLIGSDGKNTFAINKDHSDMVKYSYKDPICEDVLVRLRDICVSSKPSTAVDAISNYGTTGIPVQGPYYGQDRGRADKSWIQSTSKPCLLFTPQIDIVLTCICSLDGKSFRSGDGWPFCDNRGQI